MAARDLAVNEEVDEETAWTVKLASDVLGLGCSGGAILGAYKTHFLACLDILLATKCSALYKLVVGLFRSCLRGLLLSFPTGMKSVSSPQELNIAPEEFISVRFWCQTISQFKLRMDWHLPAEEEFVFAEELIARFLEPALEKLRFVGVTYRIC